MDLLVSPWFFKMVEQHGRTPAQRLLAVFSVLESWLAAPGIREQLLAAHTSDLFLYHNRPFKDFLTRIAVAARARQPASLVNQLMILLQGALAEDLRNPKAGAIGEAGKAAHAIIAEACPTRRTAWHWAVGGIAAAVTAVVLIYPVAHFSWMPQASPGAATMLVAARQAPYNPDSIEAALALQEQIAKGVCPAPQLLALPPGQVTAYMNAINFRTPDDPIADRENLRAFLAWFEKTRSSECYQPPVNGHTTVAWVAG
jgi:hypothetical protein